MPTSLPPTCLTSSGGLLSLAVLREVAAGAFGIRGKAADPLPDSMRARLPERAARVDGVTARSGPRSVALLEACGWNVDDCGSDLVAGSGHATKVLRSGDAEIAVLFTEEEDLDSAHARLLSSEVIANGGWAVCCTADHIRLVPPRRFADGPDVALTISVEALDASREDDSRVIALVLDPNSFDPQHGPLIDRLFMEGQQRLAVLLEAAADRYRETIGDIAVGIGGSEPAETVKNLSRTVLALLAHLAVTARDLQASDPRSNLLLPETWADARLALRTACGGEPDDDAKVRATYGLLDDHELEWCSGTELPDDIFRRIMTLLLGVAVTPDGLGGLPTDLVNLTPFEIGSLHESLLALVVSGATGEGPSEDEESERKIGGVFYTPIPLVQEVLRRSLDPSIDERISDATDRREAIMGLTVCDPACGSGNFLMPAARRLAMAAADGTVGITEYRTMLAEVIGRCIYGADRDAFAVRLARFGLRLLCDPTGSRTPLLADRFAVGDSLIGAWSESVANVPDAALDRIATYSPMSVRDWRRAHQQRQEGQASLFDASPDAELPQVDYGEEIADAWCDLWFAPPEQGADPLARFVGLQNGVAPGRPAAPRTYVHWPLAFHGLGDGPPLFDVVVGNPPYLRGREHAQLDPEGRQFIAANYPACQGGQWNLYVPFILLAARLARERSCLLVQSSVLGSQYAAALHEEILREHDVAACLDFSGVANLFSSAAVQVAALVLTGRREGPARFVRYGDGLSVLSEVTVSRSELCALPSGYWTLPTSGLDAGEMGLLTGSGLRLGDIARIQDGMEQAAAYEVQRLVRESTDAPGELRLVPTGLIDPFINRWGSKPVKYLGMRFQRPVLDEDRLREEGFPRMADQGRAEKIAIAGLSTRIEAVVDRGSSLISKSAFVIQLTDSEVCPYAVSVVLNAATTNRIYDAAFGAIGFGAGSRNYRPPTLSALPLPAQELLARCDGEESNERTRLSLLGQRLHAVDENVEERLGLLQEAEHAVRLALGIS